MNKETIEAVAKVIHDSYECVGWAGAGKGYTEPAKRIAKAAIEAYKESDEYKWYKEKSSIAKAVLDNWEDYNIIQKKKLKIVVDALEDIERVSPSQLLSNPPKDFAQYTAQEALSKIKKEYKKNEKD